MNGGAVMQTLVDLLPVWEVIALLAGWVAAMVTGIMFGMA